jgi:hypothetical protein
MPDLQTSIAATKRLVGTAHEAKGVSPVESFVTAALREVNRLSPYQARTTLTGDGTDEYPLGSLWTRGVSVISRARYLPDGDYNERFRDLAPDEYDATEVTSGGAAQIRFLTVTPPASAKVILEHTAVHTLSTNALTTLSDREAGAVEYCAAALLLRAAAASVAGVAPQSSDMDFASSALQNAADAYRRLADDMDARFREALGLPADGSVAARPVVITSPGTSNARNFRRLTHPRRGASW